jgi:hypothetical protein
MSLKAAFQYLALANANDNHSVYKPTRAPPFSFNTQQHIHTTYPNPADRIMPSNHGSGSAWDREMPKYWKKLDEKELENRRKHAEETRHLYDLRGLVFSNDGPSNGPLGGGRRSGGQHESPRPQYSDPPHRKGDLPPREEEHFYDPRDYEPCDLPPGGGPRYGGRDELPRRQVGDNPQREGTWSQSVHHHSEMPERRPTRVDAGHYELSMMPPVRYKVHWDGPPSPRRPPPGQ